MLLFFVVNYILISYRPVPSLTLLPSHYLYQVASLLSTALAVPALVSLKSRLPDNPIEDPAAWAWGRHPDNGLDYKARDNLEVSVCLANPKMINTAKCSLPLQVCLDNPQYLSR